MSTIKRVATKKVTKEINNALKQIYFNINGQEISNLKFTNLDQQYLLLLLLQVLKEDSKDPKCLEEIKRQIKLFVDDFCLIDWIVF